MRAGRGCYIPVNVGYEALALRWIYATTVAAPGSPELEKLIKQIVDNLAAFRSGAFGVEETTVDINAGYPDVTEKYLCMGIESTLPPMERTSR